MRLICPECAAQYEIADGLIPTQGRDVECSACGHGWWQQGEPTLVLTSEAAVDDDVENDLPPDQAPPVARNLDDPVFAILREEAERELAARAAERGHVDSPDTVPVDFDDAGLPDPEALAASLQWVVPERAAAAEFSAALPRLAGPAPAEDVRPPAMAEAATLLAQQRRRAHDRGFATAILVAALLAGAYVAAPSLAGQGNAGAQLMQARDATDRGRIWLHARATSMTDGVISGVRNLID